jgi:hypothetical protein
MNAVINRITRMAERIAPSLRTSCANLGLDRAITTAMPAHCNESVSATRTTAALVWRMKIMCQGREFHFELVAIEPCRGNLLFVNPDCQLLPGRLCIGEPTLDSPAQRRHSGGADGRHRHGVVKRSSPLFHATGSRVDSHLLLLFSLLPTGIGVVFLHVPGENFRLLTEIFLIHHAIHTNDEGHHAG